MAEDGHCLSSPSSSPSELCVSFCYILFRFCFSAVLGLDFFPYSKFLHRILLSSCTFRRLPSSSSVFRIHPSLPRSFPFPNPFFHVHSFTSYTLQILQTISGGSRGLGYIYAGRVVAGIGVGAISAVAPAYVSECSPKEVRGRITGIFQIMVAIGVMLSYFINREFSFFQSFTHVSCVRRLPLSSRFDRGCAD